MQRILSALIFLTAVTTHAADWPNFRGPNHDGISTETGWKTNWPAEGPKRLWKTAIQTGFSAISISQGRAYTMGNSNDQDTIWCFDAENGKEIWHHTYHCSTDPNLFEGGPTSTPTVQDGKVFTLSRRGDVFSLDAATGKILWSTNVAKALGAKVPNWGFAGSPLIVDNALYFNLGTAGTALELATGKVLWSSGPKASGYTTPVPCSINSQSAIVLCNAADIIALETKTGKTLWQHPWKTDYDINAADPIITGDQVFVSSGYEHGAALLQIKGTNTTVLWQNKNMRNQLSSSILVDGYIYGMDGNSGHDVTFKCLELKTGNVQWSHAGFGTGTFMVADKKFIILGDKGLLSIAEISPTAFKPIASAQVLGGKCWTMPVLSNGRIYCRNAKGDLICLDVK